MSTIKLTSAQEKERKRLHVAITQVFSQEFAAKFGHRYSHQGAIDGAAVKRFIHSLDGEVTQEQVLEKLHFAWGPSHKDTFVRENLLTLSAFLSQWNRISALQARTKSVHGCAKW